MESDLNGTSLTNYNKVWDPGERNQGSIISKTLSHFLSYVSGVNDVSLCGTNEEWEGCSQMNDNESRTELDSHVNMPVVGSECYVIADTGRKAVVCPY